jgi:hypothetical protein
VLGSPPGAGRGADAVSARGDWWLSFMAGATVAGAILLYGIFKEWWG